MHFSGARKFSLASLKCTPKVHYAMTHLQKIQAICHNKYRHTCLPLWCNQMDLCCTPITHQFERIPSIGNLHLSRIQTSLKKDPTFYSKAYHGQYSVLLTNIIMSWMHYFFSRNKECTCHIETHYIY